MLGVPPNLIYDGTFTESPILTAIGLGGIFFVANSKQHLLFTMLAAFFCTIL
jgi:urea transporter